MQELTFEQVEEVSGGLLPFIAGILAGIAFEANGGTQTIINAGNSFVYARKKQLAQDIANGTAYD